MLLWWPCGLEVCWLLVGTQFISWALMHLIFIGKPLSVHHLVGTWDGSTQWWLCRLSSGWMYSHKFCLIACHQHRGRHCHSILVCIKFCHRNNKYFSGASCCLFWDSNRFKGISLTTRTFYRTHDIIFVHVTAYWVADWLPLSRVLPSEGVAGMPF